MQWHLSIKSTLIIGIVVFSLSWLFFESIAKADNHHEQPPAYLQDAVITVVLKNGKNHHFDANKWKIVERIKTKRKPRKKHVCPKAEPIIKWRDRTVPGKSTVTLTYKPNRITLLAGYGPIGLTTTVNGESTKVFTVEKDFGPITGLRYTRGFGPTWSASLEYLTNHTGALGVGWAW